MKKLLTNFETQVLSKDQMRIITGGQRQCIDCQCQGGTSFGVDCGYINMEGCVATAQSICGSADFSCVTASC